MRAPQILELRRRLAVTHVHAELLASFAQDREQALPADGRETVAAGREHLLLEVDVDVVPNGKAPGESLVEGRVGVLDSAQRLVGEDDAEPERVVSRIALPHLDPVFRVQELGQRRQVQTRRSASDDCDVQPAFSRRRKRCSFPVAVRGNAFANSITRGYL